MANTKAIESTNLDELASSDPAEILVLLLASAGGALVAAVVLPQWLPGLAASLLGAEPKAFWYLARASGVMAYLLLWFSVVLGLVVSNKMVRLWNGGPTAVELHQFTSWLAIAFALFHALILLGDRYIRATITQILLPFAYVGYEPFWVGLGQVAFYLTFILAVTFYIRKWLGYRLWRTLHYASFAVYFLLTLHGIFAGSDTRVTEIGIMYLATGLSIYFLILVRIFVAIQQ